MHAVRVQIGYIVLYSAVRVQIGYIVLCSAVGGCRLPRSAVCGRGVPETTEAAASSQRLQVGLY